MKSLANRVKVWTGTVHYADENGRPACGTGIRTHSSWMEPTTDTVTCHICIARFGGDAE